MENMTVKDMLELCQKLSDAGYGDMLIKCSDAILHKDEVCVQYGNDAALKLKGFLFHQDIAKKISNFCVDFEKAVEKFYEEEEEEE